MITGALKGYKGRTCHSAHSYKPVEIRGHFNMQGPQVCGGEGGVPDWVVAAFDANPKSQTIAANTEKHGTVWQRPKE